ncbi:MAG: alpha/beta family hydrolase [Candidatus Rokuibacteriota bacterium]
MWIEDGDHDLRARAASGGSQARNLGEAVDAIARFLAELER